MRRPAIVVFLGIHGSGKTTQGQLLYRALRKQGIAAEYVHQLAPQGWPERWTERLVVDPLLAGLSGVLGGGLGEKPRNGQHLEARALRRAMVTATAARGLLQTWLRLVRSKASLLIADRYAYDSLVRARWWYGVPSACESLFLRLVPAPDALFHVEADPGEAWRRHKGQEWSLEQLVWQQRVYQDWLKRLQAERPRLRLRIIPSGLSIEEAHRQVMEVVCSILESRAGLRPEQASKP